MIVVIKVEYINSSKILSFVNRIRWTLYYDLCHESANRKILCIIQLSNIKIVFFFN